MKKSLKYLLISLAGIAFMSVYLPKPLPDDTISLQALLSAGNVTLPSGHAHYTCSGSLTVTHNLEMNGDTILYTGTSNAALKVQAACSVSNGVVMGDWVYTTAGNSAGPYGMALKAANITVSNIHVKNFAGYGILGGPYNNLTVTNSTIDYTGYIGFYFDPETATSGGVFTNNLVDRSMIAPSTVTQLGVGIRGSTSSTPITSGWTITGNTIKMPYAPTSSAAECIEVRTMGSSTISNNNLQGGSIGISAVRSNNLSVGQNRTLNSQLEGIEFASCSNITTGYNSINGSLSVGYQIDGYPGVSSTNITLVNDTVQNTASDAVHGYFGTNHLLISGCVLSTLHKGINLQQSDNTTVTNTKINGHAHGSSSGIFVENAAGNVVIAHGRIDSCTYAVFASSNVVVDNVVGTNVGLSGIASQFGSSFTGGAHYGTNVHFYTITTPGLSFRGYKAIFKGH